jgi:hypothetical protein
VDAITMQRLSPLVKVCSLTGLHSTLRLVAYVWDFPKRFKASSAAWWLDCATAGFVACYRSVFGREIWNVPTLFADRTRTIADLDHLCNGAIG